MLFLNWIFNSKKKKVEIPKNNRLEYQEKTPLDYRKNDQAKYVETEPVQ